MLILKLDGSFLNNRRVSKVDTDLLTMMKANQLKPKGNSKRNFVLPAYQDSLSLLDSTKKTLQIKVIYTIFFATIIIRGDFFMS